MRGRGKEELTGDYDMFATGISLVVHPINPNVPTVHMNYRFLFFELRSLIESDTLN